MIFEEIKPNVSTLFVGEERGGELGVLKGSNKGEITKYFTVVIRRKMESKEKRDRSREYKVWKAGGLDLPALPALRLPCLPSFLPWGARVAQW